MRTTKYSVLRDRMSPTQQDRIWERIDEELNRDLWFPSTVLILGLWALVFGALFLYAVTFGM